MVTIVPCLGKICCLRRSQKCGQSGQGQNGQNRKHIVKIATIYKYLYLYIVKNDRVSEIDFDQNDHDQNDHDVWKKFGSYEISLYLCRKF